MIILSYIVSNLLNKKFTKFVFSESVLGSTISIVGVVWFIFTIYDAFVREEKFVSWSNDNYNSADTLE